jgi:hypothetical protein
MLFLFFEPHFQESVFLAIIQLFFFNLASFSAILKELSQIDKSEE